MSASLSISDIRENGSHFGPTRVYSVWDGLENLKPKPTPCRPSEAPPTPVGRHGARMKVRREAFAFIPCHLAISQIYHLTFPPLRSPLAAHFSACPTHRLLSLSSLGISFLQTHLCVSLPPSHSYDLGVRAAPTPSQPWIKLPRHYSDVPPAMVLHVRGVAEPACLSRPVD